MAKTAPNGPFGDSNTILGGPGPRKIVQNGGQNGKKTHQKTRLEKSVKKNGQRGHAHQRGSGDKALAELSKYIDSTYDEHYSKNKFQATEFIIDGGHGEGFCIGNILKYAQRYGKKNGKDRRDLLKVIHYGIIALHVNDMENGE